MYYVGTKHTSKCNEGSVAKVQVSLKLIDRLKSRYRDKPHTGKTGWPKHKVLHYVKLAIVRSEDTIISDEYLKFVKLTSEGTAYQLLQDKQQLHNLKDIFNYEDRPCRLVLIIGGPGEQ